MKEVIYPNGETLDFETKDEKPTLEELQAAVGGYIEVVTLSDGNLMIIDEEGKLKHKEPNHVATERAFPFGGDTIVGEAVVLSPDLMD